MLKSLFIKFYRLKLVTLNILLSFIPSLAMAQSDKIFINGFEAWVVPLGIPAPDFGINEVAPDSPIQWPQAEAVGFYYIDNTHPLATDSGNSYGYPDLPRLSIPTTLTQGELVEIHGGPYEGGQLRFDVSGTNENPVWVRGANSAQAPVIRRETRINGSYAIFENLKYDTSRRTIRIGYITREVNHIVIRNNEFAGPGFNDGNSAVIGISGTENDQTTDIVIYNNHIHEFGDDDPLSLENDYHGILPALYSENIWVLDNHIHNQGGDSIQIGQANYTQAQRPHHIYVGRNEFHHDRENAVDIKRADDVIVSENNMYGYVSTNSSGGSIMVVHDGATFVWALNNYVHTGAIGLISTDSTNTYFAGNIIQNIKHNPLDPWDPASAFSAGAAMHFRSSSNGFMVNNTIYNCDTGIQLGSGSDYEIIGNIFSSRAEPSGLDINVSNGSIASTTLLDYSLFDDTAGARVDWGGPLLDVASLQTNENQCQNCPNESSALFVNDIAGDFSLQVGSPARDAGSLHGLYATFLVRYGINVQSDINGVIRPSGSAVDIGATEQ